MITESKVIELFCMVDDFCKFFDAIMAKYMLKPVMKRKYHHASTMSKAEIMLIMILFHDSGYRSLKHFYLEKVRRHMRHLFPNVVSYNRFVELEKEVAIPLALFIKNVLLGKCTGISFVDSTHLRVCRNQRIHIHRTFKGIAQRGKYSMGWFFGFKLHLICNERGELLNFGSSDKCRDVSLMQVIKSKFKVFIIPESVCVSFQDFDFIVYAFNLRR